MTKIFSYVLRIDDGAAPNPFHNYCTLAICKPKIRKTAEIGDWVIGTGSKNAKLKDKQIYDFSNCLVYAMKITDIMTFEEYDQFCQNKLANKIPNWKSKNWIDKVGDCIYDFGNNKLPSIRKSVHNETNRITDLGGLNVLISNQFYYFGEEPKLIPEYLETIIKRNQNHKKIEENDLVQKLEKWLSQFELNKLYAEPQMKWVLEREISDKNILKELSCRDSDDEQNELNHCK